MPNLMLFDWISFTSPVHDVISAIRFLGLENELIAWQDICGFHSYNRRKYFGGISIHYNSDKNSGIWIEMCGEGCRTFETVSSVDWSTILWHIVNEPCDYHITRLDVAYDDRVGELNLKKIDKYCRKKQFSTHFRTCTIEDEIFSGGKTIYFGSRKSDVLFRIYDKAIERCLVGEHWIRFEIQLRDENAYAFIKQLEQYDLGTVFLGVVSDKLRFIENTHSRNVNCDTAKWWLKFLDGVERIKLYTPCNLEYNLQKLEDFLYKNVGNCLDTAIRINGVAKVLTDLHKNKPPKKAVKYTDLENKHGVQDGDPIIEFLRSRGAL